MARSVGMRARPPGGIVVVLALYVGVVVSPIASPVAPVHGSGISLRTRCRNSSGVLDQQNREGRQNNDSGQRTGKRDRRANIPVQIIPSSQPTPPRRQPRPLTQPRNLQRTRSQQPLLLHNQLHSRGTILRAGGDGGLRCQACCLFGVKRRRGDGIAVGVGGGDVGAVDVVVEVHVHVGRVCDGRERDGCGL